MPKSILISGASSGIGKALSLELDQFGYQVFATVRNPADGDSLVAQASPQLTPLLLVVTQPEMITAACQQMSEKTNGELFGLINNAGISLSAAMEFIPLQTYNRPLNYYKTPHTSEK